MKEPNFDYEHILKTIKHFLIAGRTENLENVHCHKSRAVYMKHYVRHFSFVYSLLLSYLCFLSLIWCMSVILYICAVYGQFVLVSYGSYAYCV